GAYASGAYSAAACSAGAARRARGRGWSVSASAAGRLPENRMNWHRLVTSIGIVMSTVGCATGPTELAAGESEPPMPQVARLQKPDAVVAEAPGPITQVRATNRAYATPPTGELRVR